MKKNFKKFEKKLTEEKKLKEENLKKEKKKLKEENLKEKLTKKSLNKKNSNRNEEGHKTQKTKKKADSSSDRFSRRNTFIRILNYFRNREFLSVKRTSETDIADMDMKRTHTIHNINECKSNESKLVNEKFINKVKEEYFERYVAESPRPAIKSHRRKFSFNEPLAKPTSTKTFPAESSSREKSTCAVKLSTISVRLEKLSSVKSVPRVKISTEASFAKRSSNTSSIKSPTKSSIETLSSKKIFSLNKRLLPHSATPIAEPFGSIDQILDLWLIPTSSFTQILQNLQNEKKMYIRNEVAAKNSSKKSDPLLVVEDIFRRTQNLAEMFDLSVYVGYVGAKDLFIRKEYVKSGPVHLKQEEILVKYDQKKSEADLKSAVLHQVTDIESKKIGSKSTFQPTDSMEHKLIQKFIQNNYVDLVRNPTYQKQTETRRGLELNIQTT